MKISASRASDSDAEHSVDVVQLDGDLVRITEQHEWEVMSFAKTCVAVDALRTDAGDSEPHIGEFIVNIAYRAGFPCAAWREIRRIEI
jgi:hypothetical protein